MLPQDVLGGSSPVAGALYHGAVMKDRIRAAKELLSPLPPVAAVGGVMYRKNRRKQIDILLIKKQNGFWTLPKGHVETGETHIHAVRRELREETGITGNVEQRVTSVSYIVLKQGVPRTKIVTYYLLRAKRGQLRPDKKERIVRVKWFPIDEALRRVKRARVRHILQQAVALLEGTGPAPH